MIRIANALFALAATANQVPSPEKEVWRGDLPTVVVTTVATTPLDLLLPEAQAREAYNRAMVKSAPPQLAKKEVDKALALGYVVKQFQNFQILYPANTFNLKDAAKQAKFLKGCLTLASGGARVLTVADLPQEDQGTIRGMFPRSREGAEWDSYRFQPGLKLKLGLSTTMSLQHGSTKADLEMIPRGPLMSEIDSVATPIVGRESYVKIAKEDLASETEPTLSIVFPVARPPIERLQWTKDIQSYFLKQCQLARDEYKDTTDKLCELMKAEDRGRYPDKDGPPRFSDMDPKDQHDLGQMFKSTNGRSFQYDTLAQSFLMNAETVKVDTVFTLMSFVVKDRQATHAGLIPIQLSFRCPVGP